MGCRSSPKGRGPYTIVYGGHLKAARLLLGGGANPNDTNEAGFTALAVTAKKNREERRAITGEFLTEGALNTIHLAILRELLKAGANPAIASAKGRLPIHFAASRGDQESIDIFNAAAPETLNRADK